jgi:hypothetical protein
MSNLICQNCKYRVVRENGCREFISCIDKNKEKGFYKDDFDYHTRCTNYEKESEEQK